MSIEIALYEPLIPGNTGNIGRLCTGLKIHLHLIEPLGFDLDEKKLKRAGLDYWPHLDHSTHKNFPNFYKVLTESYIEKYKKFRQFVCFTKYAETQLQHFSFEPNALLVFGKETTGVPKTIIKNYDLTPVKIPILGPIRSYNLANSVAIGAFEALRQTRFANH